MAALLDVNVLIALMHERHVHNDQATTWLDGISSPGSVLTCRFTQMGALRLTTMASVMGTDVRSAYEFWEGWDRLMTDDRFAFVHEPTGLTKVWRQVTELIPSGTCAGTDAYLAAIALSGGWSFVTFDRAFRHFPNLNLHVLGL
jgi:toxin-antitoxin system PIN domain toxin